MVTRQSFVVARREYTVSPEPRQITARLAQVLVRATLRDETTGLPPRFAVSVSSSLAEVLPKAVEGGLAGLAGIPGRVFSNLQTSPYTFDFAIEGDRVVAWSTSLTLGPQPGFPDSFTPADLGTIDLHREPVTISGRTTRRTGPELLPIAGVTVRLTGLWRQIPPNNVAVPADAPNLIHLATGAHLARNTATGNVRSIAMTPVAGDTRLLLEDCRTGGTALRVSDQIALAAGSILELEPGVGDRTEFLIVQSVAGATDPALPATVTLEYPARRTHRIGAAARQVNAGAPGPSNALAADLIPGDRGLIAASMTGLAGAAAVEIFGGPALSDYQPVSLLETVSDPGGYYRLPPLCRAGQIELTADNGADPPIEETVVPGYGRDQQTVNFSWS